MKLDFGTHINGHIIDCAFTVAFNPKFDPLMSAVRDATYTGKNMHIRFQLVGKGLSQVYQSLPT